MTIETIEGVPVCTSDDKSFIGFLANGMIDDDGAGPSLNDPCFQPTTTLRHSDGSYIDSTKEPGIVVAPQLIRDVPGTVLGCLGWAVNTKTRLWTPVVVYDIGPTTKIGEMSVFTAQRIGVPPSPTTGGVSDHTIQFMIWPGVQAVINGITYPLQPSS
jgi:hypothetical protein